MATTKGKPRGQIKPPAIPITQALDEIMDRVNRWAMPVGVFIIGGNVRCMRATSPTFDHWAGILIGGFVGTYNKSVEMQTVMEDLRCFYPEG